MLRSGRTGASGHNNGGDSQDEVGQLFAARHEAYSKLKGSDFLGGELLPAKLGSPFGA